jgi:uncharacterized membrane protein
MRRNNLDLIVAGVWAACSVLWALLPYHIPIIGIVLALPLVFLLPGYLLTCVLVHQRTLDGTYYLTFSIGLSIAIDVLLGFILNILPGGLQITSWAAALSLCTLGLIFPAVRQRRKTHIEQASSQPTSFSLLSAILLGLAVLITISAIMYSASGVVQQPHKMFTQLWLLPSDQANHSCTVRVGIQNLEAAPMTYNVKMNLNKVPFHIWSSISLNQEKTWEQQVTLTPGTSETMNIEVQLYQVSKPETVYRDVQLTLHVSKDGQELLCDS